MRVVNSAGGSGVDSYRQRVHQLIRDSNSDLNTRVKLGPNWYSLGDGTLGQRLDVATRVHRQFNYFLSSRSNPSHGEHRNRRVLCRVLGGQQQRSSLVGRHHQ